MLTSFRYKICCIVFLLMQIPALSQQGFTNYTVKDGLPSNETYQVFQDSKGYIWIATDRGVSRFNGYEFENFTTEDGLPDNTIFAFFEDYKGRIWFNSYNGKIGYYHQQKFVTLKSNHTAQYITSIYVDTNDVLFVDYVAYTGKPYYTYALYPNDSVGLIDITSTTPHLLYYILGSSKFYARTGPNEIVHIYSNLLTTSNLEGEQYDSLNLGTLLNNINVFDSLLYVSTFGEVIYIYDIENHHTPLDSITFPQCRLSSFLIDKHGGMWVSSLNQGIYYKAKSNLNIVKGIEKIAEVGLTHFYKQKNYNLIVNKKDQIFVQKNNTVKKVADGQSVVKHITSFNGHTYISNNSNVFVFDASSHHDTINMASNGVAFDQKNDLWMFIGNNELIRLKGKRNRSFEYDTSYFQYSEKKIRILVHYRDTIWIGGINGLSYFDIQKETFHALDHPLSQHRIEDAKISSSGILFMATRGVGMIIKKGSTFYQISQKEGLINNLLDNILLVNDTIWVSSHTGISRITIQNYAPLEYTITNITTADGLLSKQVNYIYAFNDTIYATTDKGVNYFPQDFENEKVMPTVEITNIHVGNEDIELLQQYELTHKQNTIFIDYLGLYYPNPKALNYRYRLCSETDSTWRTVSTRNISFSSLRPGIYTFELKAIAPNGVESEKAATVQFIINPPFWLTWWFKTILTCLLIALITLFFKVNILSYNREITRKILLSILWRLKKQKFIEVKNIRDGSTTKILLNLILFAKSDTHYIEIQLHNDENITTRIPLKELLDQLQKESPEQFIQVHKSYLVNTNIIDAHHRHFLKIGNVEIPIGRAYKDNIKV